jgi:putative membrane protein insertion efficiency factor
MERPPGARSRRRRIAALALLLALGACAMDLSRPPESQWSAGVVVALVHTYQRTLSPRLARFGVRCRFQPTCSRYAEEVLRLHGLPRGAWLTLGRIARCGPWTPQDTVDLPR